MTKLLEPNSEECLDSFFLATTALDEYWDKSAKVIFLGEWCRRYSKAAVWQDLDSEILPDLWSEPQQRKYAYNRINELYEWILPRLASRLNKVHGVLHSNQYWRLVIGNWLYYYISILYDRHAHLTHALKLYPEMKTVVLSEECHIIPENSLDVMKWIMTDSYNLQIYSRILTALGREDFSKVKIQQKLPTNPLVEREGVIAQLYSIIRKVFTYFMKRIGRGRLILHKSYFPRYVELLLMLRSGWMIQPSLFQEEVPPHVTVDRQKRQHLMDDSNLSGDEFEKILVYLLHYDIPKCFVEGYSFVTEQTKYFPVAPQAIFSSNSWAYDEAFKQWAGSWAERGSKLLCSQHGGGYTGIGAYSPYESFEISIADRYYSWGWNFESKQNNKVKSMPPASFTGRIKMPADNQKSGILYLSTAESRYMYSLQDTVGNFTNYIQWQARFTNAMAPQLQKILRVRLHPWDCGWDYRDRWHDCVPEITFDDLSRPFLESLKNCRLYLSDHLGTTFYEALYANRPTIIFFNLQSNPLNNEANSVFNSLRRAGILHDTPESAAYAVTQAYTDVETWWNDPCRQMARQDFCKKYVRVSSNALSEWLEEFKHIAEKK